MLTVLFLICLGQLLAVGVHAGTWRLCERAPGWIWGAGLLTLIAFGAAFYGAWNFVGLGNLREEDVGALQYREMAASAHLAQLELMRWVALFCFAVAALGFYHSFLTKTRWQWPMALRAMVEAWGEIGVGLCFYLGMFYLTESLTPRFHSVSPTAYLWPPNLFAMTLLALALFRPVALKVAREMYSIRSKRVRRA